MKVVIETLPKFYHKINPRFWPGFPPIFPDGDPTEADRDLARKLFLLLDEKSKTWYRKNKLFDGLE